MIGRTLAHYHITAAIGAGGMGEVFRATDTKLGRAVALKVLPSDMARDPERLARFQREARAIAALNHPHIVTIYSVDEVDGIHFLTMELIEGESLAQLIPDAGLAVDRALAIGTELADALAAAHDKGIVHRDLKPANVMITTDGRVKVLDFGLAKELRPAAPVDASLTVGGRTEIGVVMGTPAYMSPEQVAGRPLDHRTDIFSLGILLYQMASGQRPFEGATSMELASAILRDVPRPLTEIRADVPADLGRLIRRCLEKDVQRRVQTARDVGNELRDIAGSAAQKPHIAPARVAATKGARSVIEDDGFWVTVLPFKYSGGNPDVGALVEGLSEEIVTGLSRFSYLRVMARAVDQKVTARYVMDGSVRQAGSHLRLTVQVVDAATGAHLWAETYDRPFQPHQIFALQDDLIPRIISTCADMFGVLARSISEAVRSKDSSLLTPYEALMRSFGYHHRLTPDEHAEARAALERAIEQAPANPDCWAMLSWMYTDEHGHGFNARPGSLDRALTAARRAVDIAPSNHLAQQALARAHFFRKEMAACRNACERALALNPLDGSNEAIFLIAFMGEWDRGTTLIRRAMELNPHHPGWYRLVLAFDEYRRGNYRDAINEAVKANVPGVFWTNVVLAEAYGQLGETDEARKAVRDLLAQQPDFAASAEETVGKWFERDVAAHSMDGLRKAGLFERDQRPADSGAARTAAGFWIVVRPFKYAGSDADVAALADGLSEEIVTGLSRFSYLKVVARGAAHQEAAARYVLEGSLRQAGSQLRLAVQLVDTTTSAHLWAETYNRAVDPHDLFAVQDDLVPRVVSTVADAYGVLPHTMSQAVRSKPADQLSPYEALLRSFSYAERVTSEEHAEAKAGLARAVEQSPGDSDCWAMLSITLADEYGHGFGAQRDTLERAVDAARRAVDANPANHRAHQALAWSLFLRKDVQASRHAGERALSLNPMDACTAAYIGQTLAFSGDWDRGLDLIARARPLNPNHPGWYWYAPFLDAYRKGHYSAALTLALKMNLPGVALVEVALAATYGQLGDRDAAERPVRALLALKPDYGAIARVELLKWFDADTVAQLIDGLRKAGLDTPSDAEQVAPATAGDTPGFSDSGAVRAADGFWVAVLPFKCPGASADLAALAAGLSEQIVTGLSRFSYLRVIARSSTSRYANTEADVRTVGKEMGARYVLEGSLRQAGSNCRLAVQLVDALNGVHLWAETFDRTFRPDDIFALQDELVPRIVSTVADQHGVLVHSMSAVIGKKSDAQLSPHEAALRVFGFHERMSADEHEKVRALLERAVEQAPDDSDCWAMLATVYTDEHMFGFNVRPDPLGRAQAAARRAVELSPSSALASQALAQSLFFRKELQACRPVAERTITLNPMDGAIRAFMGILLALCGDWERGCAAADAAMKLNPHFPGWYWLAPLFHAHHKGDYGGAVNLAMRINIPGYFWVPLTVAAALGRLGDLAAAQKALGELLAIRPDFGSTARNELEKWFQPDLVESYLDGLRQAGLDVAPSTAGSSPIGSVTDTAMRAMTTAPSIAVLPFANLSADKDQEYFSDGLAEEIINLLAQVSGLKVIARTSAFAFRGKEQDIREIAGALGVTTVLQGSVRRAGSRIRVSTQLINASDGAHLWSERFDRELTEVFVVQDEIAAAIAGALKLKLTGQSAAARSHDPNLAAYDAFLKGKHHYYQFSPEHFTSAEQDFTQAIQLDPHWAEPHAALGDLYFAMGFYGWRPLEDMVPRARDEARKALERAPSHPLGHAVLGIIAAHHDYNWQEAADQFWRVGSAEFVHPNVHLLSLFYLLSLGRFDAALDEVAKAIAQDPLNSFWRARRSWVLANANRHDESLAEGRTALELDETNYQARMMMALSHTCQGNLALALEAAEEVYRTSAFDAFGTGLLGGILSRLGEKDRAQQVVASMTGAVTIGMTMYHLMAGEIDAALDWYQKDIEAHRPNAPMVAFAGWLEPLRASPRWPHVAGLMNLPTISG